MTTKIGKCKFCFYTHTLVKSHIIPRALYGELRNDKGKVATEMSPHEGEYPARRPSGYYDYFLCFEHESQFNDWDTYACELLRDLLPDKYDNGWIFRSFDYPLIKLFFLSLLWRAHCADISFFNRVNLGPHEKKIRNLIANKDPSVPEDYAISLWRSEESLAKGVIAPLTEKYDGVNYIRFYLPGYMALIKVDKRPLKKEFKINLLTDSNHWYLPKKTYQGSSEEKMMLKIYKKNKI